MNEAFDNKENLSGLLDNLKRAKKQREVILHYFSLQSQTQKPIKLKTLQKSSNISSAVINALVEKNIFEIYTIQTDRILFDKETNVLKELSEEQNIALTEINTSFETNDVCLFHGITSSGKTEIYAHLIQNVLDSGKQVLYLLPEIALTTQIISRLRKYFGNEVGIYHSRYSRNERAEVWNNVAGLDKSEDNKAYKIILGPRSAIFLPFENLGLIIVDEEHDYSYKQFDPAPRYHARDAAIFLAILHNAKVLLGTATPAIESYFNAKNGKYALVELTQRYGGMKIFL